MPETTITWAEFLLLCQNFNIVDNELDERVTADIELAEEQSTECDSIDLIVSDEYGSHCHATIDQEDNITLKVGGPSVFVEDRPGKVHTLTFLKIIDHPAQAAKELANVTS